MRTIGLIGGMSWQTTALYYKEINQHVASKLGSIHSAELLLRSVDYAQIAALVTAQDFTGLSDLLCHRGLDLKAAGAQALVLCANVAHKAADALETASGLPVLHIADFTGAEIVRRGFRRVGLLGTKAVMREEFYRARLETEYGLEVFVPDEAFQDEADGLIFRELSQDPIPESARTAWSGACDKLARDEKVECVVLACTELRLVFGEKEAGVPTIDTTVVHARGVAEWALGGEGAGDGRR